MSSKFPRAGFAMLLGVVAAAPASAQGLETLGTRAAGMSAFVAVADDPSAVAWNPAGFVTGPLFNAVIGIGRSTEAPESPVSAGAAGDRVSTFLVGFGSLPVGLAYYRIAATSASALPTAAVGTPGRQDQQVIVRTLVTSHIGATVQQSVGEFLTLGATLKLVRGTLGFSSGSGTRWDDVLNSDANERRGSTRGDLDLGAMLAVGAIRVGTVLRNVTAPTFAERVDEDGVTLRRHMRVGVAWADRWPGAARTVVAVDADVTRVERADGERRDVAAGVERWLGQHRVGIRGGVRASTIGETRPVVTTGASYALRPGMYVDVHLNRGHADSRGWGVAARLTY